MGYVYQKTKILMNEAKEREKKKKKRQKKFSVLSFNNCQILCVFDEICKNV